MEKEFFTRRISRRQFIKDGCLFLLGLSVSPLIFNSIFKSKAYAALGTPKYRREAMFYKQLDEQTVQCQLCPRRCTLSNGQRSFCRVREPKDGKLYSLVYELPCTVHIDPIEKKPFFHVLPGATAFSIATAGCNLRCKFCQNWSISQSPPEDTDNEELSSEDVVNLAIKNNCPTIAYTYTEPTVFYEYMVDTAKLAKSRGLINLYHTGGFINPQPAEELTRYLNAANVDLKGFDQKYLEEICQEDLEVVLDLLKILKRNGVWVEITNLVVPTLNDDMDKIREMAQWIKQNLSEDTPLHFSRFWPQYKLRNLYPTPVQTLEKAWQTAVDVGLNYVYIGNVPGHRGENTFCPRCKKMLINRIGYDVLQNNLQGSRCKFCGYPIAGIWS